MTGSLPPPAGGRDPLHVTFPSVMLPIICGRDHSSPVKPPDSGCRSYRLAHSRTTAANKGFSWRRQPREEMVPCTAVSLCSSGKRINKKTTPWGGGGSSCVRLSRTQNMCGLDQVRACRLSYLGLRFWVKQYPQGGFTVLM